MSTRLWVVEHVDCDTQTAVLEFINRAPYPQYLTERWQLASGLNPGVSFPVKAPLLEANLAAHILALRDSLPGKQLDGLQRLNEVEGFDLSHLDILVAMVSDCALYRNRAELCLDGPTCLQTLLEIIGSAKNYIHLACFLFFNDEAGQAVARALEEKARQGVEVRVMLDQRSSQWWLMDGPELRYHPTRYDTNSLKRTLAKAGVKIVDMQPIERKSVDMETLYRRGVPDVWLNEQEEVNAAIWNTIANWNHVDHRKMVVVDGRCGLVMSYCIGNEYLYYEDGGPRPGDGQNKAPLWHDGATLITGGAAARLHYHFAKRWILSGGDIFPIDDPFYSPPAVPEGCDTVIILDSKPGDVLESWLDRLSGDARQQNSLRNFYAHDLIWRASEEVWIQNPYILDRRLFRNWQTLLSSKPQVRFNLMRPHLDINTYPGTNIPGLKEFVKHLFRRGDTRLIKRGARILEYTRAFTHLKIALVDNWLATHGSYNLNYRSAKKDLELNVIVESRSYAEQVKKQVFDVDLEFCQEVRPTRTQRAISTALLAVGDLSIVDLILPEVG